MAQHVTAVDPGLRVALPWRPVATGDPGPAGPDDDPARLRAAWRDGDVAHQVRLYDVLPGRAASRRPRCPTPRSSRGARPRPAWPWRCAASSTPARAGRCSWDVQHALSARAMLDDIRDPRRPRRGRPDARRLRGADHAGLGPAAGAGRPHRPERRQHAHRRRPGSITGVIDFGGHRATRALVGRPRARCSTRSAAGATGDELLAPRAASCSDGYGRADRRARATVRAATVLRRRVGGRAARHDRDQLAGACAHRALEAATVLRARGYDAECAADHRAPLERTRSVRTSVARRRSATPVARRGRTPSLCRPARRRAFGPAIERALLRRARPRWRAPSGGWLTDAAGRRLPRRLQRRRRASVTPTRG